MKEEKNAHTAFAKAELYFSQGNFSQATTGYEKVLQLTNPTDGLHLKALNNLSEICLKQENFSQAKGYLDQLLALKETAKGLTNLAHYYLNGARDVEKAEEAITKSLAQEESLEALLIAGIIYKRKGQRQKAQGFFQKILKQDADHAAAREQLPALFGNRCKTSKPPP